MELFELVDRAVDEVGMAVGLEAGRHPGGGELGGQLDRPLLELLDARLHPEVDLLGGEGADARRFLVG